MAWFKVDDGLHASRKVLSIPRNIRLAAVGLWTIAGAWSAHEELDGFVPDYMIPEFGGTKKLVDALITSGLWDRTEEGPQFHNWAEYQPTRAELEAARAKETERKRKWRERQSGESPAFVPAGQDAGRDPESGHPDPTRPDPTPITTEKTDIGPVPESALVGARASSTAEISDTVFKLLVKTCGPLSARGAVELADAIAARAKHPVEDRDAYVASVCRKSPTRVQFDYERLDLGVTAA